MARRRDGEKQAAPVVEELCAARRIQLDLEVRGVPQSLARAVSEEVATFAAELTRGERESVLEGVALAFRTRKLEPVRREQAPLEMQGLFEDFASELKRIDEGLRMLASYMIRIRNRVSEGGAHTVH